MPMKYKNKRSCTFSVIPVLLWLTTGTLANATETGSTAAPPRSKQRATRSKPLSLTGFQQQFARWAKITGLSQSHTDMLLGSVSLSLPQEKGAIRKGKNWIGYRTKRDYSNEADWFSPEVLRAVFSQKNNRRVLTLSQKEENQVFTQKHRYLGTIGGHGATYRIHIRSEGFPDGSKLREKSHSVAWKGHSQEFTRQLTRNEISLFRHELMRQNARSPSRQLSDAEKFKAAVDFISSR